MSKVAVEKLAAAVDELRAQVAELTARLARIEPLSAAVAAPPEAAAAVSASVAVAAEDEGLTEELMLAISAAVAAFLGERAHIRAVRLTGSTRWSQQGRVNIQASHRLERI